MLLLATALLGLADPVDLRRWKEVTLPGAPFQIDVPPKALVASERVDQGIRYKTWKTEHGFLSVEIHLVDRSANVTDAPRRFLELVGGSMIKDKKNPTAKVTDTTMLGYPAAKLEVEFDFPSGDRYHLEEVLIRVGQDDWSIQTSRLANGNLGASADAEEDHIFASVRAPVAKPVLIPLAAGRMKMSVPAPAVAANEPIAGEWATLLDKWTTYTIDDKKGTQVWVYHMRSKPGKPLNPRALGDMMAQQAVTMGFSTKKRLIFEQSVGGTTGYVGQGAERTKYGDGAVRIITFGNGDDLWGVFGAGPNSARTETMFDDMAKSIVIAP
ncbi:hypothetical protein [Sphingomonas sp.]|jgi:hypothetical protein|uniref:hypothetical protein n=1 Tax=Sphingomonas sp. TaxID=28214 RepID=UPI002EDB36AD